MKLLPEKFTKKGFKHSLLKREDNVALYKRHSIASAKNFHYEVVVITSHNGISIDGNYIEPGELYPSSSQWGTMGWTFCQGNLAEAEQKFQKVKKSLALALKNKEAKRGTK